MGGPRAGGAGSEGGPRRAVFAGDARTATVAEARRWARGVLTAWDADELEWELSQLLTEVVTNAVLHAATAVRVVLEQDDASARVRCEVTDGSPLRPRLRRHSAEATTGRGLQLLETVAASWGVQPAGGGKTVWFEVDGAGDVQLGGDDDLAALLAELGAGEPAPADGKPGAVAHAAAPPPRRPQDRSGAVARATPPTRVGLAPRLAVVPHATARSRVGRAGRGLPLALASAA